MVRCDPNYELFTKPYQVQLVLQKDEEASRAFSLFLKVIDFAVCVSLLNMVSWINTN
jgi:hypothetical protein